MTVTIENLYTGNGSTTDYSFTFPYLDTTDIKVSLGGNATTAYSLLNATTVRFDSAPANSTAIRIYRSTAFDNPKATFYPGSAIRSGDLNDNTLQNLYVTQEANIDVLNSWKKGDPTILSNETWASTNTQIASTGAIDGRIDTKIDTALTTDVVGGQSITITDDSPGSGQITASVTAGSIRGTELAADAVDGTKISDDSINSEHYVDGSIDTQHIADAQVTHVKLANDCIDGDNIQDDVVNSEHITAGALDNEHYAAGSITSDKLNAATVVTASEQSSATANDTSFFTTSASDARYFNISTGETIKDGDTFPDNDTTIATTAAINDRIIDLVDDVGGFLPIANETSFPTANPDPENGTGTIVSIQALASNLTSNGSGVATIANGAGSGVTVTINGLANSTTYAATFGMLVETTSVTHTYKFHRQTPKATEVTTVASNVSNVNTVASNITAVTTVNSNLSNINSVNSNATNINAVAGQISFSEDLGAITDAVSTGSGTNITTVATNISNVNTLAGISANVTTVADISSNVTTVAGISSNVTSVAGNSSNINSAVSNATNINAVAGNATNINTVAGANSNINTVATSIADVNRYANEYKIANSAPGSPSAGDLWYDGTNNVLKYYNNSAFAAIAQGIVNLLEDTTPELGGHLDCNDKNLTEVGTISGTNLTLDFGTLS